MRVGAARAATDGDEPAAKRHDVRDLLLSASSSAPRIVARSHRAAGGFVGRGSPLRAVGAADASHAAVGGPEPGPRLNQAPSARAAPSAASASRSLI